MDGLGDTKQAAYADLQKKFGDFKSNGKTPPRPGTGLPIEFASTDRIGFFDDIAGIEPRQDLRYAARAIAQGHARRVAERFGVRTIDVATLKHWQAEAERRTLYLFDVRYPEEYAEGHVAGSVSSSCRSSSLLR